MGFTPILAELEYLVKTNVLILLINEHQFAII